MARPKPSNGSEDAEPNRSRPARQRSQTSFYSPVIAEPKKHAPKKSVTKKASTLKDSFFGPSKKSKPTTSTTTLTAAGGFLGFFQNAPKAKFPELEIGKHKKGAKKSTAAHRSAPAAKSQVSSQGSRRSSRRTAHAISYKEVR